MRPPAEDSATATVSFRSLRRAAIAAASVVSSWSMGSVLSGSVEGEVAGEAQLAQVERRVTDALDERVPRGDLVEVARAPQLARGEQAPIERAVRERGERARHVRRERFDGRDRRADVVSRSHELRGSIAVHRVSAPEAE